MPHQFDRSLTITARTVQRALALAELDRIAGGTSGSGTVKAMVSDITISKRTDSSSTTLYRE